MEACGHPTRRREGHGAPTEDPTIAFLMQWTNPEGADHPALGEDNPERVIPPEWSVGGNKYCKSCRMTITIRHNDENTYKEVVTVSHGTFFEQGRGMNGQSNNGVTCLGKRYGAEFRSNVHHYIWTAPDGDVGPIEVKVTGANGEFESFKFNSVTLEYDEAIKQNQPPSGPSGVASPPPINNSDGLTTYTYFGGYEPLTDVTEHLEIDLDLINIMANLGGTCGASCALKDCSATSVAADGTGCKYDGSILAFPSGDTCQWGEDKVLDSGTCDVNANAYDIWLNGQNSAKSDSMRKISAFASGAADKSSGHGVDYKNNKYIAIMNKYWKSKGLDEHTWGYDMIKAAFDGTTVTGNADLNFGTVGRDFRKEAIQKGIVYLNVFPYVIWEMQDQVNDCNAGTLTNNDDQSVHAWDEAVAFYAGSTVGGSYGTSSTGSLQFALADKRCKNFKTCTNGFSGGSQVNADILAFFNAGKEVARTGVKANGDCDTLDSLMDKISALSLVPFVQGVMRCLYKTKSVASAKEAGELWAFATAVLPFVNEVDPVAAEKLYERVWKGDFSTNSYEDIKSSIESTLTRLGAGEGVGLVTCSMVGDLYDATVLLNVGCDPTLCSVNEYVSSNVCTSCPPGTTNVAGDDASGSDTACSVSPLPPLSPPPFLSPSPPPAKASFTASYTVNGYTKSSFDRSAQDKFKNAVADILGISPGAVQILSVYNTFKKRRTLLAASGKIDVSFKVDAFDDSDAAGLSTSITSIPESQLVTKLQDFGLTEVTEVSIPTSVVFYAPPPPPPPPPTSTIQTENSSSNNATLIGAAIGAVSLPAIILAITKVFASKALRAFLLKFGGCGRRLANLIVPDTQEDVKKINIKLEDIEAFMLKQKLPRLVNTTPSLDESSIIVEKSKPLGRGGFGVVFKGYMLRSSTNETKRVAVKCLFNPTQDPMKAVVPKDIAKQINREATILCSLNHPNIIRIFGIVLNRGWIIMELCVYGSLRSILLDKDNAFETPELIRFASETATGVAYLHATDVCIVHGDLKADNVLLREDGSVCLCDFGMSEAKDRSKSMTSVVTSSVTGKFGLTVQWSSPELLKGKKKDSASDVFALAVTLWEIFERDTPFSGMVDAIVINQILTGVRPAFENTPVEFRTLIKRAWSDDTKTRPKAAQMACVLSN